MSSSSDEHSAPKRKRGKVNEHSYKRNIIRSAHVKGESYVPYSGIVVPEKVSPQTISCKCPKKCFSLINKKLIQETWRYFYSLENKNAQDTHLQTLIGFQPIKLRRPKTTVRGAPLNDDVDEDLDELTCEERPVEGSSFKKNHTFLTTSN